MSVVFARREAALGRRVARRGPGTTAAAAASAPGVALGWGSRHLCLPPLHHQGEGRRLRKQRRLLGHGTGLTCRRAIGVSRRASGVGARGGAVRAVDATPDSDLGEARSTSIHSANTPPAPTLRGGPRVELPPPATHTGAWVDGGAQSPQPAPPRPRRRGRGGGAVVGEPPVGPRRAWAACRRGGGWRRRRRGPSPSWWDLQHPHPPSRRVEPWAHRQHPSAAALIQRQGGCHAAAAIPPPPIPSPLPMGAPSAVSAGTSIGNHPPGHPGVDSPGAGAAGGRGPVVARAGGVAGGGLPPAVGSTTSMMNPRFAAARRRRLISPRRRPRRHRLRRSVHWRRTHKAVGVVTQGVAGRRGPLSRRHTPLLERSPSRAVPPHAPPTPPSFPSPSALRLLSPTLFSPSPPSQRQRTPAEAAPTPDGGEQTTPPAGARPSMAGHRLMLPPSLG